MPLRSPNEIVELIIEDLAYEGPQGLTIDGLWNLVKTIHPALDEFYKKLIWRWLTRDSRLLVYGGKDLITTNILDVASLQEEYGEDLKVAASEEWQWNFLTNGTSRKNTAIAGLAFDLLRAIAKSRDQGITSMKLAEVTGQDPRSLTGRLNNLESNAFIMRVPITKPQKSYVLVHEKFWQQYKSANTELIMMNSGMGICKSILQELKTAKNGVRVYTDLRDQLKMKEKGDKRRFTKLVNFLISKNCLEKLFISLEEGGKNFLALQYHRDLSDDTDEASDLLSAEPEEEEEEIDEDVLDSLFEKTRFTKSHYLNTFFPIQDQILELVRSGGERGLPAMKLASLLIGKNGSRYLSRYLLFTSTEKASKVPNDYVIIRGYDFAGKVKFYRYLTQTNFLSRQQKTINEPADLTFGVVPEPKRSLVELSASSFDSLTPTVDTVLLPDGSWWPYWSQYQGTRLARFASTQNVCQKPQVVSFKLPDESSVKMKNGRMKPTLKPRKEGRPSPSPAAISVAAEVGSTVANSSVAEASSEPSESFMKPTVVGGSDYRISSLRLGPIGSLAQVRTPKTKFESFKSRKRQDVIVGMVKKDGALITGKSLLIELDNVLGSSTVTDKKTLYRDLEVLREKGLVRLEQAGDGSKSRYLVISTQNTPSQSKLDRLKAQALEQTTAGPTESKKLENANLLAKRPDLKQIILKDVSLYSPLPTFPTTPRSSSKSYSTPGPLALQDSLLQEEENTPATTPVKKPKKKRACTLPREDDPVGPILQERRRKRAVKTEEGDDSFVTSERKRKKSVPSSSANHSFEAIKKRTRTSLHVDLADAVMILRTIVISQSLSPKEAVDWVQISSFFNADGITPELLRKKWPSLRRLFGPDVLQKTHSLWRKLLFANIDSGRITHEMIANCDLHSLIKLWDDIGLETIEIDDIPLFVSGEENERVYDFKSETLPKRDVFYREPITIAEREEQYKNTSFDFPNKPLQDEAEESNELLLTKTALKALFATDASKFDAKRAKKLFEDFGEDLCRTALTELEQERQIVFLGKDSQIKFELSDKAFGNTELRIDAEFLKTASEFCEVLESASSSRKGLLLSAISPNSTYAPLINLLAEQHVKCTRIDYPVSEMFQGYSSRSMVREKLESDFILSDVQLEESEEISIKVAPVPAGRPCSRLWIDLQGDINTEVWVNCIVLVLNQVLFRPGVTSTEILKRVQPSLAPLEVQDILTWLRDKNAIKKGDFDSHWVQPRWFKVLSV
ncbi:unnamed protein product [Kuraishia capsulata CBS 1993]|uniref:Uncharacterized protein n=1 Tax=Kuraishia capsulata CBS 1993 TaxID=1382522 RepID=W6MUU1_9ASCO|nr:uncharacterized protein KUCA_T00001891001 [Kuraishia capsulata CBS 1993]CDK25920.1 unnamed protein product [Kuraishia capsulata CBS 1993]